MTVSSKAAPGFLTVGQQLVYNLCAKKGIVAESVIRAIHDLSECKKFTVTFGSWKTVDGIETATGIIRVHRPHNDFQELSLSLRLYESSEVWQQKVGEVMLVDVPGSTYQDTFSPREIRYFEVPIGSFSSHYQGEGGKDRQQNRLKHYARILLATWVIQGDDWIAPMRTRAALRLSNKAKYSMRPRLAFGDQSRSYR